MTHPYADASPNRIWRRAMTNLDEEVDPVINFPFRIGRKDKVCTAGSCFAQNISRRLEASGFNFLVTEPAHPILPPETAAAFNYGRFTARYGNIYTARQLLQLVRRCYGRFAPVEDIWNEPSGGFVDPFRPQIQPGGFPTREEYELDRAQHFAAVREALESMDVFIFTLGLTESWESSADGAVFPACPGTAAGRFDPQAHRFRNQGVEEIVRDLDEALAEVRAVNPAVKVILTVSPVPLTATACDTHVLIATTYSKSVLRVAADMVAAHTPEVAYFPAYEIITGPQARGRFYAEDLRQITEEGVDRVMTLFFRHAAEGGVAPLSSEEPARTDTFMSQMREVVDTLCDEELLDPQHLSA